MQTTHEIFARNSCVMKDIPDDSVDLILTSPPYPMIEMWDSLFFQLNPKIKEKFDAKEYESVFRLMHVELNKTWKVSSEKLKQSGIFCINIGDATRSLDGNFQLWQNHSMIINYLTDTLGLVSLPTIIWRKSTNKPNKFMGSGMLPPSAYVTLEHEYILVFRKGNKREFTKDEHQRRYESAFFWEERNCWFSDVWIDLTGTRQEISRDCKKLRVRSAAYPLELACRIIMMFSIYEDSVLDPFWGTGTTSLAAMLTGRNSQGYELCDEFISRFLEDLTFSKEFSIKQNLMRLSKHREFADANIGKLKHINETYDFPVKTLQEAKLKLFDIAEITTNADNSVTVQYKPH
ncbi:MAG: site-specific DNA-methyltransferase [Planctomycetes bacterium]|nr:site-specific DNA-methyltransferase [Planctomycetota bacterium]